jgi:LuxR family maltose regulon positive regulatory protein
MAGERTEPVPPGRRHIIRRLRLIRILDESNARVLMLVAPAGYGKTTLARQWLEDKRHAWYQGGPAAGDVAALAVGLSGVCSRVLPGAGERMRARLRATSSPEQDVEPLADLLAEDLRGWPSDAWLAVDDYQFVMGSAAGERFVDLLSARSPVRIFLTTRSRPSWATARRLLYGELHEVSRAALAMDQEEASQILAGDRGEATGLLALADGWPAVIGLASLSPGTIVPDDVPEALYDFFAQELYQTLGPEVQLALCKLAAVPSITASIAEHVLGPRAAEFLEQGEGVGVLTHEDREKYGMHPLLRAFLLERLGEHAVTLSDLSDDLYSFYLERGEWDDAFSVVDLAKAADRIPMLVDTAMPALLKEGRLPTLRRWLERAEQSNVRAPVLDLAMAELAFREGAAVRAEALAEHALRTLPPGDTLRPKLLLLAGKAASGNRAEAALDYFRRAGLEPLSDDEAYEIAWGRFVAAARLEEPQASDILDELDSLSGAVPDRQLRRINARLVFGVRMGTVRGLEDVFESVTHLVPRAGDPLVRSAFLFGRAHLLAVTASYREAMKALNEVFGEIQLYRLDFALSHASTMKALVHLGLREFGQAASLIAYSETLGRDRRDVYVQMNSSALRARLFLYQGAPEQAVATLTREWESLPERSMHAEYLAMRALSLACHREPEGAIVQANEASALSSGIEAGVLNECARAIAALQMNPEASEEAVSRSFQVAVRTGNLDGLLLACRLWPQFATALATDAMRKQGLASAIQNAEDHLLARRLKLPLPPRQSLGSLTPREKEVYELLALGMPNREIAAALFISQQTSKLHTVRILSKLGLRSRTEVALHARARSTD